MLTALILSYVQNGRMRVHGSNNVGRAVHTNPARLRYALTITE